MSEFFRSEKFPWLVCAAAFFLAGATLPSCNSSKEPTATEKQLAEVKAALERVEAELNTLRQGLPPEAKQKLAELENSLKDRKKWPKDARGAEEMRQRLDKIVQALSPVAAERILPQLVRLNWGIEALWNLRSHVNAAPEQLDQAQAAIEELLQRHPPDTFPEIQKELETRLKEIAPQVRKFQVEQLLKRANRALEGKEDASAVFSSLEEFRGDPRVDEKMRELRAKVIETNALQQIESFGKNLKKTRSFANDRVRQVSLLTIQESVLRLIADLELEETAPKGVLKKAEDLLASCDKELLALADKQKEDIAKKVRCYQAWALEQIREFDSPNGWYYDATLPWIREELKKFENASEDKEWLLFQVFPSTKTLIEDELGVKGLSELKGAKLTAEKQKEIYNKAWSYFGWKNDIDIEIAYRATRDGMVKFLLPIQPNLLDPPVYQLYQQAFAKGWQKLEGHNGSWIWDERGEEGKWVRISDQLFVAQQSAVVKKKTLEEVASEYRCK